MKVTMHNWMRPEPLETTVERLARFGYDGIEIAAEPASMDAGRVRALLEDHGIECSGALAMLMGGRDLFHEDAYVRDASVRYVKDAITLTSQLEGSYVTIPPTVGKILPMASPEEEWRWCVEGLREIREHAGELGVRLALEPLNRFETYLINRHDQALALAEEVGDDCGVCLDIFHMNMEEASWPEAIRAARDRLVHFHVADNNRLAPGQGAVDWPLLLRTLDEGGYDGWLSVEFMPPLDRTPVSDRADIGDASEADVSQGMVKWLQDHGSGVLPERYYEDLTRRSIEYLRSQMVGARVL